MIKISEIKKKNEIAAKGGSVYFPNIDKELPYSLTAELVLSVEEKEQETLGVFFKDIKKDLLKSGQNVKNLNQTQLVATFLDTFDIETFQKKQKEADLKNGELFISLIPNAPTIEDLKDFYKENLTIWEYQYQKDVLEEYHKYAEIIKNYTSTIEEDDNTPS